MTNIRRALEAAAAVGGDATYVEDVFSTNLYTGNGTTGQTITTGFDLAGEGGLVWIKSRSNANNNQLFDTVRGHRECLVSNDTAAEAESADAAYDLTAFTSAGFTLGGANSFFVNDTGYTYAAWTFREAPGFFDIVTWTGDAVDGREIAHNLGSVPGCIIAKRLSGADNWAVYHRESNAVDPEDYAFALNTAAAAVNQSVWNDTAPTDSVFTVDEDSRINGSGSTYVAYLFAHDDQIFGADEDKSIINCGGYTGNGSATGPVISLGWEPQYILIKNATDGNDWIVMDSMRGLAVGGDDDRLQPNTSNTEGTGTDHLDIGADGFQITNTSWDVNHSGALYIYIAIRRGPMKVPEAGTEVYTPIARAGNNITTQVPTGFTVDMFLSTTRDETWYHSVVFDRLRGTTPFLVTSSTAAEASNTAQFTSFDNDGITVGPDGSGWINNATPTYVYHLFQRAPEFMDIVCYTGTGSAHTQAHGLGVAPELWIVKNRGSGGWCVGATSQGSLEYAYLDSNRYWENASSANWNSTLPTASVFSVGTYTEINASSATFVAYLFATLAGVSKVGTYTGTAATLVVDCGFAAGARFVLMTTADVTGDWYVYDSARGIVAGNDPYLLLNDTAVEVTGTDYIDPENSGFELTAAGSATVNVSGEEYVFLAIA